jgi:hypothetical protein
MSGNPIRKANIAGLQKKLEQINGLDKEGLKELYNRQQQRVACYGIIKPA